MDLELAGRTALVTGSYRGTGAGIARVLAGEGVQVLVHGFELGPAEEIAGEIRASGGQASAVHGDIRSDEGAAAVIYDRFLNMGRLYDEADSNFQSFQFAK